MEIINGSKYRWRIAQPDSSSVLDIASRYNVSFAIAQTLVTRGYTTHDQVESFLFSSFEKDVAHPALMKDAQKAVERIIRAIDAREKILIAGDYDVDGITSSALMMTSLLPLGAQINFFLPHRVRDGYGLSVKTVERAAQNGYKVIVTVDNGITAFEPARRAKELGIDLIITDHHKPHDHLPDAYAVVDPHQHDCPYPFKYFAGVGVSFKLMTLLYELKGIPSLPVKALELLLLGTVADVVPLKDENRFWVRHCLLQVNRQQSISLNVLKSNGKVDKAEISATDVGFSLAPQINALGRLEDPRQGVKFLLGVDEDEVAQVGKVLYELNQARKEIERSIVQQVQVEIESGRIDLSKENIVVAASDQWPPGVIGLVASRIVGQYGRPTILLHVTDKGIAKGSCRSIPEFNMFNALEKCKDLLLQFGGHAQAAGLSLEIDKIPAFKQRLEQLIAEQLTAEDLQQKIRLDAEVALSELTKKFITDMQLLEPFGNENPQPAFYLKGVSLVGKPSLLKDVHVKCAIFADGVIKQLIFFNRPDIFTLLTEHEQGTFDVAAHVSENHWNGRSTIELNGIDIALRGAL